MNIKGISPTTQKILILALGVTALILINKQVKSQVAQVSTWPTKGDIYSVNSSVALGVSKDLPLISYKPLTTVEPLLESAGEGVSDSLFFTTDKQKRLTQVIKKKELPKPTIDYKTLLNEHVKVDSISTKGAIVNGRFVEIGNEVRTVNLLSENGKKMEATLVSIDHRELTIIVSVGGSTYRLKMV